MSPNNFFYLSIYLQDFPPLPTSCFPPLHHPPSSSHPPPNPEPTSLVGKYDATNLLFPPNPRTPEPENTPTDIILRRRHHPPTHRPTLNPKIHPPTKEQIEDARDHLMKLSIEVERLRGRQQWINHWIRFHSSICRFHSSICRFRKKIEKGVNDLGREQGDKEVEMKAELNQLQEEMAEMKKNVKKKLSRARRVHGKLANWLEKAETLEGRTELD